MIWYRMMHRIELVFSIIRKNSLYRALRIMTRKINEKVLIYCFLIRVDQHCLGFIQLERNSVSLLSNTKQGNWYLKGRKSTDGTEENF